VRTFVGIPRLINCPPSKFARPRAGLPLIPEIGCRSRDIRPNQSSGSSLIGITASRQATQSEFPLTWHSLRPDSLQDPRS